jgi:hypothetical protein
MRSQLKVIQVLVLSNENSEKLLDKTYALALKVLNYKKTSPISNVNVKIFRIEKEPISPQQWVENLKNGAPFKKLMLSTDTDSNGAVTVELTLGTYEVKVEKYGLSKICELRQPEEVLFTEPKRHWWE